jgi:cystathionine gamma-synthase
MAESSSIAWMELTPTSPPSSSGSPWVPAFVRSRVTRCSGPLICARSRLCFVPTTFRWSDDVVATPFNVDLSGHADLIATSLTKFIAGTGDVMGGALICNPRSALSSELKAIASAQHEDLLFADDAALLDAQARSFPQRMEQHNRNGLLLAERLRAHPAVERVWYPKWEFNEVYEAVRRPQGGWSSLVTFLPRNAESRSPRIYDRMAVCKGPSLGTTFTLACPFTLLAHYTELEWAESCGVSRHLIRISVGLEDPEILWQRIDQALMAV